MDKDMKIVIVPDSFKGTFKACEVAHIMENVCKRYENITTISLPSGDGGEGTLSVLSKVWNCELIKIDSVDLTGKKIEVQVGVSKEKKKVIVESAKIIGFELLDEDEKNPLITSSEGIGILFKYLFENYPGYEFYLTLGGTGTMDCGKDLVTCMGIEFLDEFKNRVKKGGGGLIDIQFIDDHGMIEKIKKNRVKMICDVKNFLNGEKGAAKTYGPQKGATVEMVELLKDGYENISDKLEKYNFKDKPGFGAAGGIPALLNTLFKWEILNGANFVFKELDLDYYLGEADLIITGEGCLDSQSFQGKLVGEVIKKGVKFKTPIIGIAGMVKNSVVLPPNVFAYSIQKFGTKISSSKDVLIKKLENTIRSAVNSFLD
jgi:glycerate 2-kinase